MLTAQSIGIKEYGLAIAAYHHSDIFDRCENRFESLVNVSVEPGIDFDFNSFLSQYNAADPDNFVWELVNVIDYANPVEF